MKRGDMVKILVGQEGGTNMASGGAGGGGGSFVVTEDNRPLLVGEYLTNKRKNSPTNRLTCKLENS